MITKLLFLLSESIRALFRAKLPAVISSITIAIALGFVAIAIAVAKGIAIAIAIAGVGCGGVQPPHNVERFEVACIFTFIVKGVGSAAPKKC